VSLLDCRLNLVSRVGVRIHIRADFSDWREKERTEDLAYISWLVAAAGSDAATRPGRGPCGCCTSEGDFASPAVEMLSCWFV